MLPRRGDRGPSIGHRVGHAKVSTSARNAVGMQAERLAAYRQVPLPGIGLDGRGGMMTGMMTGMEIDAQQPTVVGFDLGDRVVLLAGGPLAGGALGWVLAAVADWATRQRWVPFKGPLELIASWDQASVPVVLLGLGALAGLAFALYALWEGLSVRVTDEDVTLRAKGRELTFDRGDIAAVFVDGKRLVLLGPDTHELAREAHDVKKARLAAAFRGKGYPWADEDPHAERFSRWVPDAPDLSPGANAVFRARSIALEKKQAEDADDLRKELAKLGYVVRDEKTRQYWRTVTRT